MVSTYYHSGRQRLCGGFCLIKFALAFGQDRFGFPVQQHVTLLALDEEIGGFAGILGQHIGVLVDAGDEAADLGFRTARAGDGSPEGQEVSAGAARGLGIGQHHIHVLVVEILPGVDLFGVAGPHKGHYGAADRGGVEGFSFSQPGLIRPACWILVTSAAMARLTTSASRPSITALVWEPEPP